MGNRTSRRGDLPPNLRERALSAIKQGILDSRYAPGSLISEGQLADELQISRTPIREALRELAGSGLVRILPQRGIIVSELSMRDIIEVYQLREQLECFAVRLATERAGPEDRAGFDADHQDALRHAAAGRLRAAYDASVLMHARVIELARNGRLGQIMRLLGDQVHRFGLLTLRHGRVEPALGEHGAIIAAILRQDADAAETLMRAHLRADRDVALRLTMPAGISPAEVTA
ncbi:GntR family transcriptional regulator [Falsiroseomonas sp. CW058]|uniref:GntR family transcriptional regulator n=1 Tax=Falsiroseomonas sp. CW058 TaxID=3388664 RepID=UPI003D31BE87